MTENVAPASGARGPGWYPDPSQRFRWRWWDGEQWTRDVEAAGMVLQDPKPVPRPRGLPVDAKWVRFGAALLALLVATLVVGVVSVVTSEAWSYSGSRRVYVCEEGHELDVISGVTWLAWGVLVALSICLLFVWLNRGRGNAFLAASALTSVGLVAFTWPVWLALAIVADCAM